MSALAQVVDLGLVDLAKRINAEHEAATAPATTGMEHAIECGRLLVEAKAKVGHGDWLPWVRENCEFHENTAVLYMRSFRAANGEIHNGVVNLSLHEFQRVGAKTLSLMAKAEPNEREALATAIGSGEVRTFAEAKQFIVKEERPEPEAPAKATGNSGPFSVLYVDPPWRYEHVKTRSRAIENQYPTMSLDEICALAVTPICETDCTLFMWATSPKLAEAMRVIEAWGFTYRTCAVWVKDKIGMGYYFRQRHELLLVATKGSPRAPTSSCRIDSVFDARRGKHSAKPLSVYEAIETLFPRSSRVELFARRSRKGWAKWGNEK